MPDPNKTRRLKYGRWWSNATGGNVTDLDIELAAFKEGMTRPAGGLGKAVHFRRAAMALMPSFEWNPWAQKQIQALCAKERVGFAGGTGSSKSDMLAVWVLINWYCDPLNTLVIVVSTSAVDAKQRIWGSLTKYYRQSSQYLMQPIGRLIDSLSIIKIGGDEYAVGDNSAIVLVPAGDKYKNDATIRLQGRHNKRVILVLDELQDCAGEIISKAIWSLDNNPYVHISAACNPNDMFGPDGAFFEPKEGWASIDKDTESWPIKVGGKVGIALHFDAEKTPNKEYEDAGKKPKWEYLPHYKKTMAAREALGEMNPEYWRKYIGFWLPADIDDKHIFTPPLIIKHGGRDKVKFENEPHKLLSFDPAYTEGGDRAIATHLQYGRSNGLWVLQVEEQRLINRPKGRDEEDYHYLILEQFMKMRDELNIHNRNCGVDASAGGLLWSMGERYGLKGWHPCDFSGAATDTIVSASEEWEDDEGEPKTARDMFFNRTTELCYVSRHFLEHGQLKGLTPELAREMCLRTFTTTGRRKKAESKKEMKKRIGYSPDLWDSLSVGVDIARQVHGAVAGGVALEQKREEREKAWERIGKKYDPIKRRKF